MSEMMRNARDPELAALMTPAKPQMPVPVQAAEESVQIMAPMEVDQVINLKTITDEDVKKAEATLKKYRDGKTALESRVIENNQWWRQRHWDVVGKSDNPGDPHPTSAWLFNSLANKHADFMDNYPSPVVLPREQMDKQNAQTLTSILPVIMEQNNYEQAYDNGCWDALITGVDVQGVFWDKSKLNGLGDITVKNVDVLNLFWEPGITDLQKSANVFHAEYRDADVLKEEYPQLREETGLSGTNGMTAEYINDENIDKSNKALVVDWYYKRRVDGRTILHYCKFCAGHVLYASENEPEYAQNGFYDHGKYPFVVGSLFPIKDSIGGFGYVDVMKSPQIYIDKLDQSLLKNTVAGARPRWWVRNDGAVNEEEYADMSKDFVHFTGSGNPQDSIFPIQPPAMNTYAITLRQGKIDELKETSGNSDFAQGSAAGGITAASAIAALQEAGSKLSRDMIKERYRSYREIVELCIELIRQFYTFPRMFRITGQKGEMEFVSFGGQSIGLQPTGDALMDAMRLPVFDVKVVAEKSSPFSTVVQNERAKELYAGGFFQPQNADQALMCLEMMTFDGIDEIKQKISQNSTMFKMQQQIAPMMLQMATELDAMKGTQYAPQIQMMLAQAMPQIAQQMQQAPMAKQAPRGGSDMETEEPEANSVGDALDEGRKTQAGEARKRVARMATPR